MRRLLSVLVLLCCGLACASLPRLAGPADYIAPAASVTVNGVTAQRYGDFTCAATNLSLADGTNTFESEDFAQRDGLEVHADGFGRVA